MTKIFLKKRGVFFSTDALIALTIIFLTLLSLYPIMKYSEHKTNLQSDVISVLSNLKVGEMDDAYVQGLIDNGSITNGNLTILEQIGEFYVDENPLANELAENILSYVETEDNIGIWYGNDLLASKNSSPIESSENIEVQRHTISGIEKGKETTGFVAKAWLKKISEKQTSTFVRGDAICGNWRSYSWGYYCGSIANEINYKINIPENATIDNAWWLVEGSWVNQYNELSVNGNQFFSGNIGYYQIFDITSYLNSGENTATMYSTTGGDDGASHIVVDYTVPEMQTFEHQTIFPFNKVESKAVLHYEKSVFIPTEILEMSVVLNTTKDVTLYFRKGSDNIEIGKKYPSNDRVEFTNSEIESALSSNGISYSDLNSEYLFFIVDIGEDDVLSDVVLGENSYVEIDSSEIEINFGMIDIIKEIPIVYTSGYVQQTFYRNLVWEFFLPVNSIPVYADWQFGWLNSGGESEQEASANGIILYDSPPDDFLSSFSRFGYTPIRADGVFVDGENNFSLNFGTGYSVSDEASQGYIVYFVKSYVNYGEAKQKASGGTISVEFEDGSSENFLIGNSNDAWDPDLDAIDDAVERLLQQLDSDGNGKIDLIIDQENFDIESLDISGVPYIWSTEIQVRIWK